MTIFASRLRSVASGSKFPKCLETYFRSGWAFFIPYLAAYLLYAWLDWPVNPAGAGSTEQGAGSWIPCLLHVYWLFHALHLVLGAFALWSWWRSRSASVVAGVADPGDREAVAGLGEAGDRTGVNDPSYSSNLENCTGLTEAGYNSPAGSVRSPISDLRSPSPPLPATPCRAPSDLRSPISDLLTAAPWLCLALLFWIPGIYLEWPSDPWEHLRRINEWHALDIVTAHSSWIKSSYFLPYSLTGHTTGLTQLSWLNFYYTGICLLLSWQYYRLARAVGLSERASFVFVLISALTLGNSVFSFYRYYGLSSSILAQIGAIALTRIVLEALSASSRSEEKGAGRKEAPYALDQRLSHVAGGGDPGDREAVAGLGEAGDRTGVDDPGYNSLPATGYSLLRLGAAALALLPLIAFNHIQGLGIAGLGVGAVVVWRLIEWKRAMIGWLALAAVLLSLATVIWFPRHPALDEVYRPEGWLNAWYGFNLFAADSIALERSLHILGAFGLVSLVAGLWLIIRRNHIAGWLTLLPVIALALPCFALPFAHVIAAQTTPGNIVIFHRYLLAVPLGLAVVAAFSRSGFAYTPAAHHDAAKGKETGHRPLSTVYRAGGPPLSLSKGYPLLCFTLLLAVGLSAGKPTFSRFWHSLQVTSDDLELKPYIATWTPDNLALSQNDSTLVVTTPLGEKIREVFGPSRDWRNRRQIHATYAAAEIAQRLDWLNVLDTSTWSKTTVTKKHWQLSPSPQSTVESLLVADFTSHNTPWIRLGGNDPEYVFVHGQLTISNPIGTSSQVFNPNLIPLDRTKRYRLTSTIRQIGNPTGTSYLAVAWYDENGQILRSNAAAPEGAGRPIGWSNGTFSYYGLHNHPAPTHWTTYTIDFGLGERAAIPHHAYYFRTGALLNYGSTHEAIIQLRELTLHTQPTYERGLLLLPSTVTLNSSGSLAARLSSHWAPHQIAMEHAGLTDLHQALNAYHASPP